MSEMLISNGSLSNTSLVQVKRKMILGIYPSCETSSRCFYPTGAKVGEQDGEESITEYECHCLKPQAGALLHTDLFILFPIGDKDPRWYPSVGDGL